MEFVTPVVEGTPQPAAPAPAAAAPRTSTTMIHLNDVCMSDMWEHQKKDFFQWQCHSKSNKNTDTRDEVFVFHLLEVHARFCVEPSCKSRCTELNAPDDEVEKLNLKTKLNFETKPNSEKKASFNINLPPYNGATVTSRPSSSSTSFIFSTPDSDCSSFTEPAAPAGSFHPVSMSTTVDQHDQKPCLTNVSVTKTDVTDSVPTFSCGVPNMDGCCLMFEDAKDTEITVRKVEPPDGLSHDQVTCCLTWEIKREMDDEREGLEATYIGSNLHVLPENTTDVRLDGLHEGAAESPDVSHDQEGDVAMRIKREKETVIEESVNQHSDGKKDFQPKCNNLFATGGIKTAIPRMKTARVMLHKLDIQKMPTKCEVCHKMMTGSGPQHSFGGKEQNHATRCDRCLKDVTEVTELPKQAMETEANVPRETTYHSACHETSRTYHDVKSKYPEKGYLQVDEKICSAEEFSTSNLTEAGNKKTPHEALECVGTRRIQQRKHKQKRSEDQEKKWSDGIPKDGNRPFKCELCAKTFPKPYCLKKHMISHSGVKPHKCGLCSKAFSRKHHLTVHMNKHSGERPFSCSSCSMSFYRKDHLSVHIRKMHTGVKPYSCKISSKAFSQEIHLTTHMKCHPAYRVGEMICSAEECSSPNLREERRPHTRY